MGGMDKPRSAGDHSVMSRRRNNVLRFESRQPVRSKRPRRRHVLPRLSGRAWTLILVVLVAILTVGSQAFGPEFPTFLDWLEGSTTAQKRPEGSTAIDGTARIIDGDTLEIRGRRIRLHGIDAPESRQQCKDAAGRDYRCGQRATQALSGRIGGRPVACEQRDIDRYNRVVAICRVGSEDLNAWLVAQGWAVAYRYYSTAYVGQENEARAARRGVWSGTFTSPSDWRRQHR